MGVKLDVGRGETIHTHEHHKLVSIDARISRRLLTLIIYIMYIAPQLPESEDKGPFSKNSTIESMEDLLPFIFQLPPTKNFLSRTAMTAAAAPADGGFEVR